MAGLIEKNATETYTLRNSSGIIDGKQVWAEKSVRGLSFELQKSEFGEAGSVQTEKVFLIAPQADLEGVTIPAQIVHGTAVYDVMSVKALRNLRGDLLGFRVASVFKG
jgi:hypothetical protein